MSTRKKKDRHNQNSETTIQDLNIHLNTILNEAGVVTINIAEEQVHLFTHDFSPNMLNKECPVNMLRFIRKWIIICILIYNNIQIYSIRIR